MVIGAAAILPFILVPIIAVVAGVGIYLAWKAEQQRKIDLRALASDFGLSFDEPRATRVESIPFTWHRGEVVAT